MNSQKKIRMFLVAALAASPIFAIAQDAPRPATRAAAPLNFGLTCPTGQVVTLNPATGSMQCTDTVARATTAATAETANTANTANTAVTSQNLDPNARINSNQLQGTLSSSQMGLPSCATGQVLTNVGGTMTCVTGGGGGSRIDCPARSISMPILGDARVTMFHAVGGTTPSLSVGQSGPFSIGGRWITGGDVDYWVTGSGSANARCNADGSLFVTGSGYIPLYGDFTVNTTVPPP